MKLRLDGLDRVGADRAQIRFPYPGQEDREQCSGVREEEALPAIEPEQVRVPVLVSSRQLREGDSKAAEQIEHPPRAPQDHWRKLASVVVANSGGRLRVRSGQAVAGYGVAFPTKHDAPSRRAPSWRTNTDTRRITTSTGSMRPLRHQPTGPCRLPVKPFGTRH
jgi:hypothetical protein